MDFTNQTLISCESHESLCTRDMRSCILHKIPTVLYNFNYNYKVHNSMWINSKHLEILNGNL